MTYSLPKLLDQSHWLPVQTPLEPERLQLKIKILKRVETVSTTHVQPNLAFKLVLINWFTISHKHCTYAQRKTAAL